MTLGNNSVYNSIKKKKKEIDLAKVQDRILKTIHFWKKLEKI